MSEPTKFFLGSKTRFGFVPLFKELNHPKEGGKKYILKGSAGCGKSTLMKKLAERAQSKEKKVQLIHCASDPNSLDAVFLPDENISVLDGTPPHVVEPVLPGSYEILVPLGEAFDNRKLAENLESIMSLSTTIKGCHNRATSYISAAAALLIEMRNQAMPYVDMKKLLKTADSIIKSVKGEKNGKETRRLLSAVSVGKVEFFDSTISSMCKKVFVINDGWGAVKTELLKIIAMKAQLLGLERILCPCSIMGDETLDHIIFPKARVAVVCSNSYHKFENGECISAQSLMNPLPTDLIENFRILSESAEGLITRSCREVKNAKELHDDLEAIYKLAIDFCVVENFYRKISEDF